MSFRVVCVLLFVVNVLLVQAQIYGVNNLGQSSFGSPTQSLGFNYGGNPGYANNNYGSYRMKPGQCPRPNPAGYFACPPGNRAQCTSDYNCYGALKCCQVGSCAATCVYSERQQPTSGIKPGFCPYVPPGTIGTCIAGCNSDYDCASSQKCCTNGCGRVCKDSQQVPNIAQPTIGFGGQPLVQPYRQITPIQNGGFNVYGKK